MRATIYGVQEVDFVTANNEHIVGKNLYCGFENRYVQGLKTNKFFVSNRIECFSDLKPDIVIFPLSIIFSTFIIY